MSTRTQSGKGRQSEEDRATIRAAAPRRGPGGGGGPFGGMGMPAEKSLDFGPSAKRLFSRHVPKSLASTWWWPSR